MARFRRGRPEVHSPPSTLPEAEEALRESQRERVQAARMWPLVNWLTGQVEEQKEVNHLAERFRGALRGGAA